MRLHQPRKVAGAVRVSHPAPCGGRPRPAPRTPLLQAWGPHTQGAPGAGGAHGWGPDCVCQGGAGRTHGGTGGAHRPSQSPSPSLQWVLSRCHMCCTLAPSLHAAHSQRRGSHAYTVDCVLRHVNINIKTTLRLLRAHACRCPCLVHLISRLEHCSSHGCSGSCLLLRGLQTHSCASCDDLHSSPHPAFISWHHGP